MSISDASVVKDFYSVEFSDGALTDVFEGVFATVEGPAAKALDEIEAGVWPVVEGDREALAWWIALQLLRGERNREQMGHRFADLIRIMVGMSGKKALRQHIEAHEQRELTVEELDREWDDLTKPGGPTLVADPMSHIHTLMGLVPGTGRYLADSHWTLLKFTRKSLVTSDHPVTLSVDENYPKHRGIGIFTADLISLPLSRRLALTIQPRRRLAAWGHAVDNVPDFQSPGTTSAANALNQATVAHARRYVFMHPEDVLNDQIKFPNRDGDSRIFARIPDSIIQQDGVKVSNHNGLEHGLSVEDDGSISLEDVPWPIPGRSVPWSQ